MSLQYRYTQSMETQNCGDASQNLGGPSPVPRPLLLQLRFYGGGIRKPKRHANIEVASFIFYGNIPQN